MEERIELGIQKKEGVYFHSATDFTKEHLYYLHWGALYYCNHKYSYTREYLDAYIFFHIKEGEMHFQYREQDFTLKTGESVILDCKHPNKYWADGNVTFYWFHFSGSETQSFCDLYFDSGNYIFSSLYQPFVTSHVKKIMNQLKEKEPDDFYSSSLIHSLLCHFAGNTSVKSSPSDIMSRKAVLYMEEHLLEAVNVQEIADFVGLSLFHFTRTFKHSMGIPPHDYLLSLRIAKAKEHLTNTSDSIEETAIHCGFFSTSHFIRAFKKATSFTPKQFRQIF